MRVVFVALCLVCVGYFYIRVSAGRRQAGRQIRLQHRPPADPGDDGQKQPQGWTGPLETGSGGAPPESPQGQSPPGMQSAPEGSSKTTVEPDKNK